MNLLEQLIHTLEPNQIIYQGDVKSSQSSLSSSSSLIKSLENPFLKIVGEWKNTFKISDSDLIKLEIIPNSRKYSLYTSLLTLLSDHYNLSSSYQTKNEIVEQFIYWIISRMELDTKLKLFMKNLKIRQNLLIDEIKNCDYQSQSVVYYMALIFDINICVMTKSEVLIYTTQEEYDPYKVNILLYRDVNQIYYPIIYNKTHENQLLGYHSNQIVKCLVDGFNKKIICKKSYSKESGTQQCLEYKTYTLENLRTEAKSRNIEIKKISEISGKSIYKTKAELMADLTSN